MWQSGTVTFVGQDHLGVITPDGSTTFGVHGPCTAGLPDFWEGARVSWKVEGPETFLLVLEPDTVLDVTEIVECITSSGDVPDLAILRRLEPRTQSLAALRGNLINSAFDYLVRRPDALDVQVIEVVVRSRSLGIASVGHRATLEEAVRAVLPKLRAMLNQWEGQSIVVESHTISGMVGLQGRFDILVRDPAGAAHLVELKAGTAPSSIRLNHAAQVSAYALLYELLHNKQPDSCSVWYLADDRQPLRRIDHTMVSDLQRRLIATRNQIIIRERRLGNRSFAILKKFTGRHTAIAGPASSFESTFSTVYSQADTLSRTAAQAWLTFLINEQQSSRAGDDGVRSMASLWQTKGEDKASNPFIIQGLKASVEKSSLDRMHIHLESKEAIDNTSLRAGDLVYVYAERPDELSTRSTYALQKGTLRHVYSHGVEISLRNKQVESDELFSTVWTMEQDVTTAGLQQLTGSLVRFLDAPTKRRSAILGATPPRFGKPPSIVSDRLTDGELSIVARALAAKDWFLIQGPPGTGKTSRILRELVMQLTGAAQGSPSSERILVLAYTNRAVNEICHVLDACMPAGWLLRHGNTLGVDEALHHRSIPHCAETASPEELAEQIRTARCIVSTIHSVHSQPEILSFGQFTTAIVDEASQVLDVQVAGLLAQVDRHILIGDHAQLPPVVTQPAEQLRIQSTLLEDVELRRLDISIFERMVCLCKRQGWEGAMATLTIQGRMHAQVMQFPSVAFYRGQLQTALPWQDQADQLPWHHVVPSRTAFYNATTLADEVRLVVSLVKQLRELSVPSDSYSIGVIGPFRLQNRRILHQLALLDIHDVTVDTVERYQGSQRDVIIYATSVTTPDEFTIIRSESDGIDRKLNVASTRARLQFIMIGNAALLAASPHYAKALTIMDTCDDNML